MSSRPSTQDSLKVPEYQIIRCKVCGEQMREYDHGYLGCACKGWGSDVETDNDLGIFDKERHELLEVIPVSALLSDEAASTAHCAFIKHWTGKDRPAGPIGLDQLEAMRAALQAAIEQVGGGQGESR